MSSLKLASFGGSHSKSVCNRDAVSAVICEGVAKFSCVDVDMSNLRFLAEGGFDCSLTGVK